MKEFSIADIVRNHALERPGATALSFRDRVMTWRDLDHRSSRVAQGLRSELIGDQDRVAIIDKNHCFHIELLFGIAKINAVNVSINWRLAVPEVVGILNDAGARILFIAAELMPALKESESNLTSVEKIIVVGDYPGYASYEDWLNSQSANDPGTVADSGDTAFLVYTSGTTGEPKGVMLSTANWGAFIEAALPELRLSSDSIHLVTLPLFHVGGWGVTLVGMAAGCHTVLLREVDVGEILGLIRSKRITHTELVPAVLRTVVAYADEKQVDVSSLEVVAYGTAPIDESLLVRVLELFSCEFVQLYGLTESSGGCVVLRAELHNLSKGYSPRLRSCGIPMAGVSVRIVDPSSLQNCPVGEVGEVWVQAPQVMMGYWRKPVETAESLTEEGWLRTGDAGYLDDEGFLFLKDRIKDMIVSGGENIYPAEVENALAKHPNIDEVAVVGVPSDRWGETVKAFVVLSEGASMSQQEAIEHAKSQLARYKCPTSIEFRKSLPRNTAGKILKRELREPYWRGLSRKIN